jgi:hypothetical protein
MKTKSLSILFIVAFVFIFLPTKNFAATTTPNHHNLKVTLHPLERTAIIQDQLTVFPANTSGSTYHLFLHADFIILHMEVIGQKSWSLRTSPGFKHGSEQAPTKIHIQKPGDAKWPESFTLKLEYAGKVLDLQQSTKSSGDSELILLAGQSVFYPQIRPRKGPPELVTFEMQVQMPKDWVAISQGERVAHTETNATWKSLKPMEEIFLIVDRFHEFSTTHKNIQLQTFLKEKDAKLAQPYLQAAKRYIDFYQRMLGDYPFAKFALVENSQQTGWGMPSFTLMGSRIIRFPFILNTSYPHEILHNWWGNGVYISPDSGNWSEGLTAYLADHLLMELDNKGPKYRYQELLKYSNYVTASNDFPLSDFRARDSMASQAIGYGKMLMVFHMLRLEVGDANFLKALRHFYQKNRFQFAGFDQLRHSFESVSGKNLQSFFAQWTQRTGAPAIQLLSAEIQEQNKQELLRLDIRQTQEGPAFSLKIPVAVWIKGASKPFIQTIAMHKKSQSFTFIMPERAAAVRLDPYNDLFRKLDASKVPPSIGKTYGAKMSTAIISLSQSKADYQGFARALAQKQGSGILLDINKELPEGSHWVLGKSNQWAEQLLPQLKEYGVEILDKEVLIDGKKFPLQGHSFVFTLDRPDQKDGSATWVITDSDKSVPGLIRKLPHYGKYGYLVFKGDVPDNQVKGTWPSKATGLAHNFLPGKYDLPSQPPLVDFKP